MFETFEYVFYTDGEFESLLACEGILGDPPKDGGSLPLQDSNPLVSVPIRQTTAGAAVSKKEGEGEFSHDRHSVSDINVNGGGMVNGEKFVPSWFVTNKDTFAHPVICR
ncbi:hypothetical protein L1987_46149 [Smallanthus sonchifolius]|uniref:Uncharacterized protein n=1 Tax=Smallanthus sonchifolius TaxID=185202 RepID=A0ACB9FZX6_9ASTR|nr:hypothetical protein L1987_46149 [Smallanthus sonchifolius]